MGADIHFFVERRLIGESAGVWDVVRPPARDLVRWPKKGQTLADDGFGFWGPNGCMHDSKCYGVGDNETCPGASCERCGGHGVELDWYHNRNYDLFGILAGVRRDSMPMIAEPRGVPSDLTSPPLVRYFDKAGTGRSDIHTPSWLLLNEVIDFGWYDEAEHTGVLTVFDDDSTSRHAESYQAWMKRCGGKKAPNGYCQGMSGHQVTIEQANELIDADPMDQARRARRPTEVAILRDQMRKEHRLPIVRVKWTETLSESAPDFLEFIDELVRPILGPEYMHLKSVHDDAIEARNLWPVSALRAEMREYEKTIRFVFGFDN